MTGFNVVMSATKRTLPSTIDTPSVGDVNGTVHSFKQSIAVPSYLLAIAVGDIEERKIGASNCFVYAEPSEIDRCATELSDLP